MEKRLESPHCDEKILDPPVSNANRPLPKIQAKLPNPQPPPKKPVQHYSLPADKPPPVPTRPDLSKSNSLVDINAKLNSGNVTLISKPPIPPKKTGSRQNSTTDLNEQLPKGNTSTNKPNRPPPIPVPKDPRASTDEIQNVQGHENSDASHSDLKESSSVSDLDTLHEDEIHVRRTNIVKEILSTERTYVHGLTSLTTTWTGPIQKQPLEDPIVPPDQVKYLFSNVEVILNVNKQFLEDFEEKMRSWSPTQSIGIVFLTLIPFFKVYMQYINNYNKSMEIYQELLRKKSFRKYVEDCSKVEGSPYDNLASYLITPVQRIPRYQLLLAELYKYTPETHSDYLNIKQALDKIKAVATDINSHKRDAENLHSCAVIQNKIIYPEGIKKKQRALVTPTRRLRIECEYELFFNGTKAPCNYIAVFSDALLIAKKKKKGLVYFGFVYLRRITSETDESGIVLKFQSFSNYDLYISIPNEEERKTLLGHLTKTSADLPVEDDDELLLVTIDSNLNSQNQQSKQKKSLRKRIMTLGKPKDKPKDLEKVKKDDELKFNPQLNNELMKKLEVRNTVTKGEP